MRILGFKIGRNKVAQARTAVEQVVGTPKNVPETFKLCALMFQQQDPSASVRILRRRKKSVMFDCEDYMDIPTAIQAADRVELHLKDQYGPGSYQLEFVDAANKHYATYSYNVGGKPTPEDIERNGGGAANLSFNQVMTGVFAKLLDEKMGGGGNNMKETIETLAAAKGLFIAEGGDEDTFKNTLLATLVDNVFVEKTNAMDTAAMILETANKLSPQVQPPDTTTALITGLLPLLPMFLKQPGGGQNGAQANQAIAQLLQILTPEQKTQLGLAPAPAQEQNISRMPVALPNAPAIQREDSAPPAGVEDEISTAASSLVGPPGFDQPAAATFNGFDNPYIGIIRTMIEQFDRDVAGREEHQALANKLISLLQFAQVNLRPEEMPAVIRDLAASDDVGDLPAAFDRFCETLPVLRTDKRLQLLIKSDLARILLERQGLTDEEDEGLEFDNFDGEEPTPERYEPEQDNADGRHDSVSDSAATADAASLAHS